MYFKYHDINLYYEKHGTGDKELIILPGWGDTRKTWNYIIGVLADYYTIYIIDYPGFGKTEFPNHDLTIYDYTNLISEWLKSIKLSNPVLLGHSFGGRILTLLDGYYGYSCSKMIFMNAAGIKQKQTLKSKIRRWFYKFLMKSSDLLPNKVKENFKRKIFEYFSSDDYKTLPYKMRKTFQNIVSEDLKDYLENIKSNVFLIWGNKDMSTPINDAYFMKDKIKNSKIFIFPEGTHFVYLEYPVKVMELISHFVETDI